MLDYSYLYLSFTFTGIQPLFQLIEKEVSDPELFIFIFLSFLFINILQINRNEKLDVCYTQSRSN